VNVRATLRALEVSLEQVSFGACKLLTDGAVKPGNGAIEVIPIARLGSSEAYSNFVLGSLVDHVETPYCLLVQWDGHVVDANRWQDAFLDYDYIGATWPQFDDGHDVGNGGFSLRSRRLMDLCRRPAFSCHHPEDIAIGRTNRTWLETQGMRFASRGLADTFAAERVGDPLGCFGYHGAFNMPRVLGARRFRDIYRGLDATGPVHHDFASILGQMAREKPMLAAGMLLDRFVGAGRRR
jgi:hypothetical protein